MRGRGRWAIAAAVVTGARPDRKRARRDGGTRRREAKAPIVIGWAFDSTGRWRRSTIRRSPPRSSGSIAVNAKGGVLGRKLQIQTCDTQGNKPDDREGVRAPAARARRRTSSSRPATSTSPRRSCRRDQPRRPRSGVRASAPTRWGRSASARRDGSRSASATSPRTRAPRWRSTRGTAAGSAAALATDTVIVYFRNVVQAFEARFKQLGGKIVARETYQSLGGNNVQNAVSRLNGVKADVIVTSTAGAFGALSTFVTGLRSLGNNTPILNSWAGDGTYWLPTNPKVTNYWFVTFASSFGDDPAKRSTRSRSRSRRGPAASSPGPSAIDGVVTAIRRAHGLDEGHRARQGDGEVQERADHLRQRQLLDERCTRCSDGATA